MATDSPLIDQRTLAAELGISTKTLEKWRSAGDGPPYVKIGNSVRYRRSDFEKWLESRMVVPSQATRR